MGPDYHQLLSGEAGEIDYVEDCFEGNLEGQYYETLEGTWMCQGSEWLQVAQQWIKPRSSTFHLAAYAPVVQGYWCSTSGGDRFRAVVRSDTGSLIGSLIGGGVFRLYPTPWINITLSLAAGAISSTLSGYSIAKFMAEC